ncbi:MAG TPA: TonB-dependent receptor [Longimicrobiales bacterium]|nr:TonB-dependent receptor [Longimicrobiales bacterium]
MAQQAGRIVGRVIEEGTGRALPGAQVVVEGTTLGAITGVDGRYLITGVTSGMHTVRVVSLGYGEKTVTGVQVPAGATASLDVTLQSEAIAVEGLIVTAVAERGTVSRALDEQRNATGVVNSITAEQMARSPDGDAAAAVQRVSGVTVQDGRYVFVRGLGERYTTTALNGARLPSPEPEKKIVPFDLFPSSLLASITTSKTFTPDQPGDFSGAQVNIRTREFPTRSTLRLTAGSGLTDGITGNAVVLPSTSGAEWLGYAGDDRSLPEPVRDAGDLQDAGLSAEDMTRLAGTFRNAWEARRGTAPPAGSFGLSAGGSEELLGRTLGYILSGTYATSNDSRENEIRTTAMAGTDGEAVVASRYTGSTGTNSVLWGGLLNLSATFGGHSRLSLNNTYNRSSDQSARLEQGTDENLGLPLEIHRLGFVERSVRSSQLAGEHQLSRDHRLDWSLTNSAVERNEPDRSEIVFSTELDVATGQPLPRAWYGSSNEAAVRTFGELDERSDEGRVDYSWTFGDSYEPHRLKVGALARMAVRDASNFAYSISAPGTLTREQREAPPEEIFEQYTQPGSTAFSLTSLGQGGSYQADEEVYAAYGMMEYAVGERLRLVGGARVERSEVEVRSLSTNRDTAVAAPTDIDVLPALAAHFRLTEDQNLRVSASRTLSRPEYRELSPILYREVLGGENVFGNAELRRARIENYDIRWEWYPSASEVVSLGVFAKRFHDPIERVYVASSGTALVTFVNADEARNYGVEAELRTDLGRFADWLQPFTAFTNATLMRSEIRIGSGLASRTNDERPMVGQAPYVLNAGVIYNSAGDRVSATLLYNVVGERIQSAAQAPLPDIYEQLRHMLDFALRLDLGNGVAAKFDARNLLDQPYEVTQGDIVRESWETGRGYSFGLSWDL